MDGAWWVDRVRACVDACMHACMPHATLWHTGMVVHGVLARREMGNIYGHIICT